MKKCWSCKELKPLDCFYKHNKNKDGLRFECKECDKKQSALWGKKNRERYLISNNNATKKWRENNKERSNKIARDWSKNNPLVKKAYYKVHHKLEDGKIFKQPCSICGSNIKIQAHHEDYSKPLDIIWLCQTHHLERHNKKRRIPI